MKKKRIPIPTKVLHDRGQVSFLEILEPVQNLGVRTNEAEQVGMGEEGGQEGVRDEIDGEALRQQGAERGGFPIVGFTNGIEIEFEDFNKPGRGLLCILIEKKFIDCSRKMIFSHILSDRLGDILKPISRDGIGSRSEGR